MCVVAVDAVAVAQQFDRVIPMIVALCTRNHFDGIVMELPISAPIVAWVRFLNAVRSAGSSTRPDPCNDTHHTRSPSALQS